MAKRADKSARDEHKAVCAVNKIRLNNAQQDNLQGMYRDVRQRKNHLRNSVPS